MKSPEQVLTEWSSDEVAFNLGQGPRIATRHEMLLIADAIWTGQINVPLWDYYGTYFSNQWSVKMARLCMGRRATGPWLAYFESMMQAALHAIFDDPEWQHVTPLVRTLKDMDESGEL